MLCSMGELARSPLFQQTLTMHSVTIPLAWQAGLGDFAQCRIRADAPRT
jgi:hypothetical protein